LGICTNDVIARSLCIGKIDLSMSALFDGTLFSTRFY
jgi:hypothetical protein